MRISLTLALLFLCLSCRSSRPVEALPEPPPKPPRPVTRWEAAFTTLEEVEAQAPLDQLLRKTKEE